MEVQEQMIDSGFTVDFYYFNDDEFHHSTGQSLDVTWIGHLIGIYFIDRLY